MTKKSKPTAGPTAWLIRFESRDALLEYLRSQGIKLNKTKKK
jgi:hypothetical protein